MLSYPVFAILHIIIQNHFNSVVVFPLFKKRTKVWSESEQHPCQKTQHKAPEGSSASDDYLKAHLINRRAIEAKASRCRSLVVADVPQPGPMKQVPGPAGWPWGGSSRPPRGGAPARLGWRVGDQAQDPKSHSPTDFTEITSIKMLVMFLAKPATSIL